MSKGYENRDMENTNYTRQTTTDHACAIIMEIPAQTQKIN